MTDRSDPGGGAGAAPSDLEDLSEQSENAEIVRAVTAVMRRADKEFERVGGSSQHYVRDCFLPELNRAAWIVVSAVHYQRLVNELRARRTAGGSPVPARPVDGCTSFYHLWQGPPVGEPGEPDAYQSCLCGKLIWKQRSNATVSGYKTIHAARPGEEPPDEGGAV